MRADTLSLTTSLDYLRDFDKGQFTKSIIKLTDGKKLINYSIARKPYGIENLCFNETYGLVRIKANSKLLKQNYHKMFCLETLDQFVDELSGMGFELNDGFLSDSRIKELHITDDVMVANPSETIMSFNHLIAPNFIKTSYPEGMVFKESIRTNPLYITIYGKEYQIRKEGKFFKTYPTLIDHFAGKIRMETKLRSTKIISKYISGITLPEILELDSPNPTFLNKIIADQKLIKSMHFDKLNWKDEKNVAVAKHLKERFNGDYNAIRNHIRNQLGKNTKPNYQMKQLKNAMELLILCEHNDLQSVIQEFSISLNQSQFSMN